MITLYDHIKESLLDDSNEILQKGTLVSKQIKVLNDMGLLKLEAYPKDLEYVSNKSKIKPLKTHDCLIKYINDSNLDQKDKLRYTKFFGLLINLLMNIHEQKLDLWAWGPYSTGEKPEGYTYIETILGQNYGIDCLVDVKYYSGNQTMLEIYTSKPCFIKLFFDTQKFDKYFDN